MTQQPLEKALRIRCGRIHEDERKATPYRSTSYKPETTAGGGKVTMHKKKKVFIKKKFHTTHVAEEGDGTRRPRRR